MKSASSWWGRGGRRPRSWSSWIGGSNSQNKLAAAQKAARRAERAFSEASLEKTAASTAVSGEALESRKGGLGRLLEI